MLQKKMICGGSQKADIYQLGMVIYQILYHARPFSDKSDMTSRGRFVNSYNASLMLLVRKRSSEVVTAICHGNKGSPFYPTLPDENDYTLRLTSIMQQVDSPTGAGW